jgi:hypothetical protein
LGRGLRGNRPCPWRGHGERGTVIGIEVVSVKLTLSAPAESLAGKSVKITMMLRPSGLPAVTLVCTTKAKLPVLGDATLARHP